MIHQVLEAVEILAVLGTSASICYYVLCTWSATAFLRERNAESKAAGGGRPTPFAPPVSILKPLRGADPQMYESFRSHCLQEYPEYEIIFGVSDPRDPAIAVVERLKSEFPQRAIRLVFCEKKLGANVKVSNLAQMLSEARHEHLIVSDSDIRVNPDYMPEVMAPLANAKVGLVTCLYRGVPRPSFGSRLESVGISTDFAAGVLAARQLESGIRFGLGSTLAFRRRDLEAVGGFESFVEYLADDYELGSRIAGQGQEVKLSQVVVETFLPRYSLREFIEHQLRWSRGVRDSRPWGYLGFGLTFGLPWALLTLAFASGARWAWGLLAVTAAIRVAVAWVVGKQVLQDRWVLPLLGLLPARDVLGLLIWLGSFFGHKVVWRGDSFILKNGKLTRIAVE